MNTMQKYTIIIAIIVLLGAGILAFFMFHDDSESEGQTAVDAVAEEEVIPTTPQTFEISADMRGYENRESKFALHYPKELSVREYKEKDGALSVVFENPADGRGFQIYAVPYDQPQITKERFQMDVSSGVMREATDIVVAGAPATMFYSQHSLMGDTREVWFINNGMLYEVVTYKKLDEWLSGIMQTWKFL